MKTEEDEAFDDLARKQGMWGGGFNAKRQAAMDKVNQEFTEEYIKYRTAFPKGYIAPQQEPVQHWSDCAVHNGPAYPAGPCDCGVKKEPIAYVTGTYNGMFLVAPLNPAMVLPVGMAFYTTPPKRPWVGLTDEEIREIHSAAAGKDVGFATGLTEAKLKEKNFD